MTAAKVRLAQAIMGKDETLDGFGARNWA